MRFAPHSPLLLRRSFCSAKEMSSNFKSPLALALKNQYTQSETQLIASIANFFSDKCKTDKLSVRWIDKTVGKGVFATKDIKESELLFIEKPLVMFEHNNKPTKFTERDLCGYCMNPTGSVEAHFAKLKQQSDNVDFLTRYSSFTNNKMVSDRLGLNTTSCEKCGEHYCSKECKEAAEKIQHSILCNANQLINKDEQPRKVVETVWILYGALRIIAKVLSQYRKDVTTTTTASTAQKIAMNALLPYTHLRCVPFSSQSWTVWEGENIGESLHVLDEIEQRREVLRLRQQLTPCLSTFKQAFHLTQQEQELFGDLFTFDGIDLLCGLLYVNMRGLTTVSPLEFYRWSVMTDDWQPFVKSQHTTQAEREEALKKISAGSALLSSMDLFSSLDVSAIFNVLCSINHSCDPNTVIEDDNPYNKDRPYRLIAARDIKEGEQLFISYLDLENNELFNNVEYRRKYLKGHYLFDCNCTRCLSEMNRMNVH